MLIWHDIENDPRTRTQSLSGQEPFMIWLKAALIAGLVLSSPWIFYQLWMFVAALNRPPVLERDARTADALPTPEAKRRRWINWDPLRNNRLW